MIQNDTNRYFPNPHPLLSPEQLNAIDLLLTGATDQHVADIISRSRITVTRWRLYHPHFRTELVRRRREAYVGASDAYRTIIPMALDTLRDQLRVGPGRGHIALTLLHKAGLTAAPVLAATEVIPQDDDHILTELLDAEIRRQRAVILAEDPDDEFATPPNAPVTEEDRQAALDHLLSLAEDSPPSP